MATYDIDLLRAIFVDRLNDPSIFLASFYEQIEDEQSVSRYVQNIKDMIALQNREKSVSNYKAMGIISQAGSAEILNIKSNYISPLEYQVRLDIELSDRDYVVDKIKTLIANTKGSKFDLIALTNGQVIVLTMPTILNDKLVVAEKILFTPSVGSTYNVLTATTDFTTDLNLQYSAFDGGGGLVRSRNLYLIKDGKLYTRLVTRTQGGGFPPTFSYSYGTAVEVGTIEGIYKLSLSFNGIQSDEPFLNNGLDRVFIFFGGSATIVKDNVSFGNDIVKTTIQVGKDTGTIYDVEPLEIPASLNINDDGFSLYANGFQSIDRNMAIQNKLSYSFVFDYNNALYRDFYKLSRYGSGAATYTNLIFTITEYRYALGVLVVDKFYAKLGDGGVQNTNGDVITLNVSFKVGAY